VAAAAQPSTPQVSQSLQTSRTHLRFHRLLVESVGSRRLTRVYRTIQGEIHLSMVQSQRVLGADRVSEEHGRILKALDEDDATGAVDLMRRHLEDACRDIARHLDKVPSQANR
jgi:DNA-binding GntR family transcriptional regulator